MPEHRHGAPHADRCHLRQRGGDSAGGAGWLFGPAPRGDASLPRAPLATGRRLGHLAHSGSRYASASTDAGQYPPHRPRVEHRDRLGVDRRGTGHLQRGHQAAAGRACGAGPRARAERAARAPAAAGVGARTADRRGSAAALESTGPWAATTGRTGSPGRRHRPDPADQPVGAGTGMPAAARVGAASRRCAVAAVGQRQSAAAGVGQLRRRYARRGAPGARTASPGRWTISEPASLRCRYCRRCRWTS